jgi:threonine synthase
VRVSGAQAAGCSPVATAWRDGSDTIRPVKPDTIAKSLAIGNPADGYFALDAVRQTGGGLAAVSDDEIVDAMRLLARTEGIFAETAGGVTIATLARLAREGVVRSDERVVVYVTGHGLKTLDAVAGTTGPTAVIEPTVDAFHEAFPPDAADD